MYFIGNSISAKFVSLKDNKIYDDDVPNLASALRRNTTLDYIDLQINCITYEGRTKMKKAMLDTTNMSSIVHPNHSCCI